MARAAKKNAADDGNTAAPRKRNHRPPKRAAAADNAKKPKGSAAKPVKKKMPPSGSRTVPARRSTAAKRVNKWSEPYVIENAKSPICDADLVKILSDRRAWECLEEDEKREILDLLPDGVHPNPDGDPENPDAKLEPPPFDFLRYSIPWRDAVRQFQIDLENSRYDPEWQRQAHQAAQERAEGAYDKWKEEQFEEFWGQKQKLNRSVIAGESSKIRLETLIKHNLVQVGDVWKHYRNFATPKLTVEKEVKILDSDGKSLTFAIPAGQRVFLSGITDYVRKKPKPEDNKPKPSQQPVDTPAPSNGRRTRLATRSLRSNTRANNPIEPSPTRNSDRHSPEKEVSVSVEASDKNGEETASSEKPQGGKSARLSDRGAGGDGDKPRSKRQKTQDNEYLRNFECDSDLSDVPSEFDYGNIDLSWETSKSSSPADLEPDTNIGKNKVVDTQKDVKKSVDNEKASKEVENVLNKFNEDEADASNRENSTSPSSAPVPSTVTEADSKEQKPPKDIVLRNVRGPGSLQAKILSIDGRIIDPPNGNAWKDFRCYRNNQDIGSLWDIRQAWYIRNYC